MKVRTRVAPSPTGDPHVGTAYVALMNYAFARKHGGEFILRVEDTDQARSSAASEQAILDSLHWLGLDWDEGPDVGGACGPYRQSERSGIYREHVARLEADDNAFRCYCTEERLAEMREAQRRAKIPSHYDGTCAHLSADARAEIEAAGTPFVVRLRIPKTGTCIVNDLRRGEIEFEWSAVDMQVLMKSDGMPTYHLANVVDDHLMGITHVLRGEEWISSAPKHVLLYRYFGWEMPQLCHLPLLRNPDKSKLSKRKNPTGILFYKQMGYLPEALLNFLGLFALSVAGGEEMMSLADYVAQFEIDNISMGGPVFDVAKLDWLNSRYIREVLTPETLLARMADWANPADYLMPIAQMAHQRIERLSDIGPLAAFLFSGKLAVSAAELRDNKLTAEQQLAAYQAATVAFDALPDWTMESIQAALREVSETLEIKFRDFVRVFYLAIAGSAHSLPLFESMALIGRDMCRFRLRHAIGALEAVAKSEA